MFRANYGREVNAVMRGRRGKDKGGGRRDRRDRLKVRIGGTGIRDGSSAR